MEEKVAATEANAATIAPQEKVVDTQEDAEARFTQLEAEKENYRKAYLKEATKNKSKEENLDEDDEDKMRRIAAETLANSRIAEIAREQDDIIKRALKENKELKLASLNKTTVVAAQGAHSESTAVQDTSITPEQMTQFKKMGWGDKEIERYKQNMRKNSR